LTIGLLIVVALRPFVIKSYVSGMVMESLAAALLLVFVAVARGRRVLIVGGGICALTLGSGGLLFLTWHTLPHEQRDSLAGITTALTILFLAYVCLGILRDVLGRPEVTVDSVFGAVAVYVLIGIMWANLYMAAFLLDRQSFAGLPELGFIADTPVALYRHMGALDYFSLCTLTTVGYGDIHPTAPVTRTLAWMEAAVGQLYLAVMIARLVALETTQLMRQSQQTKPHSPEGQDRD